MPRRKGVRQSKGGGKGRGRRGRSDNGRQQSRGPAIHGFVHGLSLSDWQSLEDRQDDRVCKSSPRLAKKSWRKSGAGNPRICRNTETTNNAVGYVYPEIQTLDSIGKAPNKNTPDRLCSEDLYSQAGHELLWANGKLSEALNQQPPIYSEENQECEYADLLSGDSKTWGLGYGSGEKADHVLETIVDTKPGRELITIEEIGSSSHKGGNIIEKLQEATSVKVSKLGDDTSGTYQQVVANQAGKVGASNYPCMPRKNQVQSVYGGQDTRRKQKERINSSKQKGRIKSLYKSDTAYLSIGGVRIYTDKNLESSDGAALDSSDEDLLLFGHKSGNRKRLSWSQQTGASCENTSDEPEEDGVFSTSDIDKDVVNDYMANGGGDFSDTDWLLRAISHEQLFVDHIGVHDDASNETGICSCKKDNDNSGWGSESSSEGENENEKESRNRFNNLNLEDSGEDDDSGEAVVDIKLSDKVPSCRNRIFNRHIKHLNSSQLMQHRHVTIKVKRKKGSKKWQHKEMVALKRRQRALLRGFDLSAINSRLEEIVLSEEDLFAFEPMAKKDCLQVQKLASIYHLKSGSQSSGKKRFVIVARTPQTKLPSGLDKNRLLDMLQRDNDMDDTMKLMDKSSESMDSGEKRRMASKQKRVAGQAFQSMKGTSMKATSSDRKKGIVGIKQRSPKSSSKRSARYAGQPVSFVSHGTMLTDGTSCIIVSEDAVMSNGESSESARVTTEIASEIQVSRTLQLGKFEAHTKGFGSRMMAKMGFVEGYGLGKDGQGMIQPLEATKRPKSLGLGALNL